VELKSRNILYVRLVGVFCNYNYYYSLLRIILIIWCSLLYSIKVGQYSDVQLYTRNNKLKFAVLLMYRLQSIHNHDNIYAYRLQWSIVKDRIYIWTVSIYNKTRSVQTGVRALVGWISTINSANILLKKITTKIITLLSTIRWNSVKNEMQRSKLNIYC
jgi:hypothetical protein